MEFVFCFVWTRFRVSNLKKPTYICWSVRVGDQESNWVQVIWTSCAKLSLSFKYDPEKTKEYIIQNMLRIIWFQTSMWEAPLWYFEWSKHVFFFSWIIKMSCHILVWSRKENPTETNISGRKTHLVCNYINWLTEKMTKHKQKYYKKSWTCRWRKGDGLFKRFTFTWRLLTYLQNMPARDWGDPFSLF